MTKKYKIIFAVVLLIIAVVLWISRNFQHVDSTKAINFGNEFLNALQSGNIDAAFEMYNPDYIKPNDTEWKRLITALQGRYGQIKSYKITRASIVPVSDIGCTLVQYTVNRGELATIESLIVCPSEKASGYSIFGHNLKRVDTGQSIAAGLSVQESSISFQ